jgi:subtilase family serine protease
MTPRTRAGLLLVATFAVAPVGLTLAVQNRPDVPGSRAQGGPQVASRPAVIMSGRHDVSPALRDVAPRLPQTEREPHPPFLLRQARRKIRLPDPVLQTSAPTAVAPGPIFNFEGVNNVDGVLPPDTNGDIGPNHYVQWVNKTFAVYSRSGSLLYGPAAGSTVWAGFGGPCESENDGDPIVLYDHLADRWVMSQFALPNNLFGILFAPFYQCIAVSQTADPTGAYYRYQYEFSKLNDYPKFGVWSDGYYMTINQFAAVSLQFAGQGVVAFDRAAMLAGQPARMLYFDLAGTDPNLGGMLPSDLDGAAPPPGSSNYFVQVDDDASGYSPDQLQLWRFHADWTTPSSSTFTGPYVLPVAAFDSNMCDYARACIPQPGTTAKLDALADRLMYRLQYRNFGTHESLVVNHTVDVDGTDHAGLRWYEIRDPGGTPVVYQQGTYAPDGFNRWMASAAMDASGNLALVYNVSGSTLAPSIRYAARLTTDPPGVLAQGENDLIIGTGSQTHTASRWGDYSMLSVDPTDGCTFWATAEYFAATSLAGWQTRVGAFRLPGCGTSGAPPTAPTTLTAVAVSAGRIDLSWTDRSSDEAGFSVERCAGTVAACAASGAFSQVGQTAAGITSYSVTGLQGGTTYSHRVRAFNSGGNSAYSNIAEATTQPTPPPPAVSVAAAIPTATEAGPTSGLFTISRDSGQDTALTVTYTLGGTAVKGTDYQSIPTSAPIPAGASSVTVAIVPIDDSLIEPDETVILTVTASPGYTVGTPSSATVTIVSDDRAVDFAVTSLTVPAAAGAGGTIDVTDVTKNQGTDGSGPSVTSFYLSTDLTLGPTDILLGSRQVPALDSGASSSGTTTLTTPASVTTGLYWVIAKADGPNAVSETNESNNTRTGLVRIGPDLLIASLTAPAIAGAGSSFAVTEATKNQGAGDAGTSVTKFYLSSNYLLDSGDTPLQSRSVPALAAGLTSSATTTLTIPAGTGTGLYYLIANADEGNTVLETSETNNTRYVTIRVGGDLTVSTLSAPAKVVGGSTIVVTDTTTNSGAGAVGASTTVFYLSTNYLLDAGDIKLPQSRAVPALAAGASSSGSTSVTLPDLPAGLWYLIANADDGNAVIETTETNNSSYAFVQVGPDLTAFIVSSPASAGVGSTIAVTDTIKNVGAAMAGASTTTYFLSRDAVFDGSDVPLSGVRSVPSLAPNASDTGTTNVVLPTGLSGTYYIIAVADGSGVVAESVETNNTSVRMITINP